MQRSSGRYRDVVVVATVVAGTVVDRSVVGMVSVTTEIDDDDEVDDEDELRLVEVVIVDEVVDFVVVVVEGEVVDVEVVGTEGIVGVSGVQAG